MLLIDDLLAAPVNGILWVFKEIQKAATEEQRNRRDRIMATLSALYVSLEQGQIDDETFDAREQSLLDELDALDAQSDDEDEDEEDESEEADEPEYALKSLPAETAESQPCPDATRSPKTMKELPS